MVTDRGWNQLKYEYGNFLDEEVIKDKAILDIGTGGGTFIRHLRERGAQAWGIDYDIEAAELNKGYPFFIHGDAYNLWSAISRHENAPSKFDLIFSSWALPSYPTEGTDAIKMTEFFNSVKEVMEDGAIFSFTPVIPKAKEVIKNVIARIPGLSIRDIQSADVPSPYAVDTSVRMQVIYRNESGSGGSLEGVK